MSAPAFTPGPWLVHATNRLVCQAGGAFKKIEVKDGAVHGDDLSNNICLLRDPGEDFSEDETLANGFLIAAAPEMYAVCEMIANGASSRMIREPLITALAKARGE